MGHRLPKLLQRRRRARDRGRRALLAVVVIVPEVAPAFWCLAALTPPDLPPSLRPSWLLSGFRGSVSITRSLPAEGILNTGYALHFVIVG